MADKRDTENHRFVDTVGDYVVSTTKFEERGFYCPAHYETMVFARADFESPSEDHGLFPIEQFPHRGERFDGPKESIAYHDATVGFFMRLQDIRWICSCRKGSHCDEPNCVDCGDCAETADEWPPDRPDYPDDAPLLCGKCSAKRAYAWRERTRPRDYRS